MDGESMDARQDARDQDIPTLMQTVARFCADWRPDGHAYSLDGRALTALTEQAVAVGILPADAEASLGLWTNTQLRCAREFSLRALMAIAAVDAGAAFHLHTLALGQWISRALSLVCAARTLASVQGAWGLGRAVLPRLLKGSALDARECLWLADYFSGSAEQPLLLVSGDDWGELIVSVIEDTGLSFACWRRDELDVRRAHAAHGLDAASLYIVSLPLAPHAPARTARPANAREVLAAAMYLDALGLIAIATGSLKPYIELALEHARTRVQGGAPIANHAAVQELLGNAFSAHETAELALLGLLDTQPSVAGLSAALSARAQLHPLLCAASNDALQVFGGLGYMRELGLERLVRDQNCLRVLHGSPGELRRCVSELRCP